MRTLLLLCALATLAHGDPTRFEVVDFGSRGRINQWCFADFDGDGRTEVLLVQGRTPYIYLPDPEKGYDIEHPFVLPLDPGALYFDVAQVDEDPRTLEFVCVTPEGVFYYTFRDGAFSVKPRCLVRARSLVTGGQVDNLHFRDFLVDLNQDGLADVVLATHRGFEIFYQRRQEPTEERPEAVPGMWLSRHERLVPYESRGSIEIDPAGLTGELRGRLEVPDYRLEDFTGDGKLDFVLDDGRSLRVFPCGEDGLLAPQASQVVDLSPLANADGSIPRLVIRDLNGDGKPDFVVTRRREGITDIYLFGQPLAKPTLRVRIPGWSFDPRFSDLNDDGRPDLVVPTTPEMDIGTALSVLLTKAITVNNHIFLNTGKPKQPFRVEPDLTREIRVKLRLYVDLTGEIKGAHSVLVEYEGDYDGDGRKDLVYRGDSDELLFFPGEEEKIFSDRPSRVVRIPDTEAYVKLDTSVRELNGDGRQDLAIFYFSRGREEDRLVILLSGKE